MFLTSCLNNLPHIKKLRQNFKNRIPTRRRFWFFANFKTSPNILGKKLWPVHRKYEINHEKKVIEIFSREDKGQDNLVSQLFFWYKSCCYWHSSICRWKKVLTDSYISKTEGVGIFFINAVTSTKSYNRYTSSQDFATKKKKKAKIQKTNSYKAQILVFCKFYDRSHHLRSKIVACASEVQN